MVMNAIAQNVAETVRLSDEAGQQPSEFMRTHNATLSVRPHKRAVLVTGDTQLVKEQLKALKGSWNKALRGWIFKWGSAALSFQKQRYRIC